MIFQVEGLGGVLDRIELYLVHFSGEAPSRGENLNEILPARLRNLTKAGAHRKVAIALRSVFESGVEGAELAEFAIDHEVGRTLHRRIGRGALQAAIGIFRRQDRLLVAQLIENKPVGRHFGGRVQPCQACTQTQSCGGDHVIELRRRGHVRIQLARTMDQYRITLNPLRPQHGR